MSQKHEISAAKGSFWNPTRPVYSKETANLLQELMRESKLTNFQQRQLNKTLADGQTLPTTVNPTTSAKPRLPQQPLPASKTFNPRNYSSRVRTKDMIESTGAYDREKYRPRPGKTYSDQDKERLANLMAYGQEMPPPDMKKIMRQAEPRDEVEVDRFDELNQEIQDRKNFLAEMEALGQGKQYRSQIRTEISQLLREMEVIDKKRTAELNRRLADQERQESQRNRVDTRSQRDMQTNRTDYSQQTDFSENDMQSDR